MDCKNCKEKPGNISYGLEFCSRKCYNNFRKKTFRCAKCDKLFPQQYGLWTTFRRVQVMVCNNCYIRGGLKFGQTLARRRLALRGTVRKGKDKK